MINQSVWENGIGWGDRGCCVRMSGESNPSSSITSFDDWKIDDW
jgi:hypothetical protein